MKKFALSALAVLATTQAMALDLGVYGTAGYSNVKGDEDKDSLGGFNVGATALYNAMPLTDKLGLAVGLGLNMTRVSLDKTHMTFVHVSPEVGLNIQVNPDFRIIPSLNFGWGNTCTVEVEAFGMTLADSADSCNQYGVNTRTTYAFTPKFVGMGQFQYDMGTIKNDGHSGDYRTYAMSIGAGYQF